MDDLDRRIEEDLAVQAIPDDETWPIEQWSASTRNRWLLYCALFVLTALVRLASFTGISLSDDLSYAHYAQLIARGIFDPDTSHLRLRVGLTVPVSVAYRLFGPSELTTILVPLLASSMTVPLLVAIGRRIFSMRAALLAGLLLMTSPTHVTYATILVPEPVMELYVLVGVLAYLKACEQEDSRILAGLAGLCLGLAYLAKEPALFVGGAFFLYSILRGKWKLALALAGGMAVIGALETAYYFAQTGDPLFRSHVVAQSQEAYFAATGGLAPLEWRLFKAYPRMMLIPNDLFAFHSITAVLLAAASLFLVRGDKVWMLLIWAGVPMLYLNFGSSSLTSYLPVALAERYIGLVYYPLFLLAGAVLCRWLSEPRWASHAAWSVAVMLCVAALAQAILGRYVPTFPSVEQKALGAMLNYTPLLLLACAFLSQWQSPAHWPRHVAWGSVVLLCVAGFSGAVANRNRQAYSAEVMALRAILDRAPARNLGMIRFEGKRAWHWRNAMNLIAGKTLNVAECASGCFVVGPDAIGLPTVTEVPPPRAEQRWGLERAYRN